MSAASSPEAGADAAIDAVLAQAAETIGTPAFVYFTSVIAERAAALRAAFAGRFELSFAVKSNPNPSLLTALQDHVELLDISSIGEFRIALRAGWDPHKLSFTGPGKRDVELSEAIAGNVGELVVESVREAVAADRIARGLGKVQDVLVRIAPAHVPKGFGDHMAGRPVAFGLDHEQLDESLARILSLSNLRVTGLHIYSGTQCLKREAICENYRIFIGIFRETAARFGLRPHKLVFGSGLGIPYHAGDTALDIDAVACDIAPDLDALKSEAPFADTRLVLELGRYLVGPAGYFVTRVVSVKVSRGTRIGICDGGMNNHLPAAGYFGMVVMRNYPMHKVGAAPGAASEKTDLSGPLCTSIDRLARGVELPRVEEGDLIALHNSGAYGPSASPIHFISHQPPREVLVETGVPRDVTWDFKV
jgi:diaminopimelate decarboxylase